jgi:regulatory protein
MRTDKMKVAKLKAGNYCAYQERTQQEVRDKLYNLGLYSNEVEQILTELILEDFINEERFARTYARGKFNLKRWGKVKIIYELKRKKISPYCIKKALEEIEDNEYNRVLNHLLVQKLSGITGEDFIKRNKTARFLINRGFESEKVWELLNVHFSSNE